MKNKLHDSKTLVVIGLIMLVIKAGAVVIRQVSKPPEDPTLATVGEREITKQELTDLLEDSFEGGSPADLSMSEQVELKESILNREINEALVNQYAKKHNIDVPTDKITEKVEQTFEEFPEETEDREDLIAENLGSREEIERRVHKTLLTLAVAEHLTGRRAHPPAGLILPTLG